MMKEKHSDIKCWIKINNLQNNVGVITDIYPPNMVEVYDEERKEYYIKNITEIELI